MSTDSFWVKAGLAILVVVAAIEVAARLSGVRLRWLRIGAVSAITGSLVAGAVLVATARGWASRDAIMAVFSVSLAIVLSVIWFLIGERPRRRAMRSTEWRPGYAPWQFGHRWRAAIGELIVR
jgi:uncharacterized membrane protein